MNHKVANVAELYNDAKVLHDNVVLVTADTIINNLEQGINNLKQNWKGADAGVQINSVIDVHNEFVVLRNALAQLSSDSSEVAMKYREIQVVNGANLDVFSKIEISEKNTIPGYTDNRDTIDITPSANDGKNKLDKANSMINEFAGQVKSQYQKIMSNWTVGTGRDKSEEAFVNFLNKSNSYIETLNLVSKNIASALVNYSS